MYAGAHVEKASQLKSARALSKEGCSKDGAGKQARKQGTARSNLAGQTPRLAQGRAPTREMTSPSRGGSHCRKTRQKTSPGERRQGAMGHLPTSGQPVQKKAAFMFSPKEELLKEREREETKLKNCCISKWGVRKWTMFIKSWGRCRHVQKTLVSNLGNSKEKNTHTFSQPLFFNQVPFPR